MYEYIYIYIHIYIYTYIYVRSTAADPKWLIGMFVFWNNMEFWNVRILWKWNIGIVVTCWFSLVSLSFEYIHICNNCHLIRKWNTDTSNCKLLFIRRIDDLYLLKCLIFHDHMSCMMPHHKSFLFVLRCCAHMRFTILQNTFFLVSEI